MKPLTVVLVLLASMTLAGAARLTLPADIQIPKSPDSPGVVTFSHDSHVDVDKPNCTACHPRRFPILKATARVRITHDRFEKKELCASCHNGTDAFAIDDDCSNCHRS